jgi:hypothetical protein
MLLRKDRRHTLIWRRHNFENIMDQPNNIIASIDALFGGSSSSFTLRSGANVEFQKVNLPRIAVVTTMLDKLATTPLADKFRAFLQSIAKEQGALLAGGQSPDAIDFNKGVALEKAFANHSLLLQVFSTVAETIPEFVAALSTIGVKDYEALELDEQLILAAGVVAVNYAFFTQSLPPIIATVMKNVGAKKQASLGSTAKNQSKT